MNKIIQIVEDDEDIRAILALILEDADFTVETFCDVKSFEDRVTQEADLILLDVMLPDGNGIEVSKSLKADSRTSTIPILIMSAHAMINDVLTATPVDGFISKPFDIDAFVNVVQSAIL
jgi:DNA-binding response OmpR family regulator